MKAIVFTEYGSPDVLHLEDVEKPTPKENEVLIRVRATTVTTGDCEVRRLDVPLLFRLPVRVLLGLGGRKILGQELAGEIESVGRDVTQFEAGNQVFAATGTRFGAYAEYVCLPSDYPIAIKPVNVSYEDAACIPVGGLSALYFLRRADVRRGENVLINGAAGSIGTYAVQLAKSFGADVTGVDSAGKLDVVRSVGADHVVDYTREDFTERGETYDVIFDVVGTRSFSRVKSSLSRRGRYVSVSPRLPQIVRGIWTSMVGGKRVIAGFVNYRARDLVRLKELVEAGTIRSVVDRRYPLEQVAEAHRYVEGGQKKGNVVVTVG